MHLSARPASTAMLRHHVEALCDRHRIEIRTLAPRAARRARANHVARTIAIAPIVDPRTYAIALHEIAHLVAGPCRGVILEEAAAWTWVREHALVWTAALDRLAAHCLASYVQSPE